MTKKIFEIEECEVAGENPAVPLNEVTPIVRMKRERDKLHDC